MIKLMNSTFYNEADTKQKLVDFIMRSERLSMGEQTKKFEENFAKKQKRKFAVFMNSGSTANLVLLQALQNLGRLKKGDRIGVSALTWSTNVMPIIQLGMIPVVIDCEVDTLNVSPRILEKKMGEIDALFLTNVLGFSDDIETIREMCEAADMIFFEDNCEALGSKTSGRFLGNFGLASTFSFFVGHHLSTIEGGMAATDDEELYHALLMARAHGWDRNLPLHKKKSFAETHAADPFYAKYVFYELGYNFRPTDIHGFLGTLQLLYWDEIVEKREKNFLYLKPFLDSNDSLLKLRTDHMETISNFAVPVIFKNKEDCLRARDTFERAGVEIRPIIAGDITKQPFFKKHVTHKSAACENADYLHRNAFYFGNHPELTEEDLEILASVLKQ